MAAMSFANVLAVAQALLLFGIPTRGSNIPLRDREWFAESQGFKDPILIRLRRLS
jgi:hypothetical protein